MRYCLISCVYMARIIYSNYQAVITFSHNFDAPRTCRRSQCVLKSGLDVNKVQATGNYPIIYLAS